jgi:hypothetical protein
MLTRPQKSSQASICDGDYYHSEHRLFRVEQTHGQRVLVEDCASGELFDIPASDLDQLIPTRPLQPLAERCG